MGPKPSARPCVVACVLLAGTLSVAWGCNGLLGTPDPELAPESGAEAAATADAGSTADATTGTDATTDATMETDTTTGTDATAGTDGTTGADGSAVPDGSAEDAPGADEGADDAEAAAPPSPPPSCPPDAGPGVTTCGTAGDSCCASLLVPAGTYFRSYTVSNGVATGFGSQATVSAFRLDKYEVTVGRFRQFFTAAKTWVAPAGSGVHSYLRDGGGLEQVVDGSATYEPGWNPAWAADMSQADGGGQGHWDNTLTSCGSAGTWTNFPSTQESLPINCVNWYEAYAFCIWDGGFLPSEAEWQYASAGGMDYREYPWGSADPGLQNQYAIYGCDYPDGGQPGVDAAGTCSSTANIAPVGSAPSGVAQWGQLDLGGNVFEWTVDWYDTTYVLPCDDCAQLSPEPGPFPWRSTRGGDWLVQPGPMLTYARTGYTPITRDNKGGIRCARAP